MFCKCPVCRRTTLISREHLDEDLIRCDHCRTTFLAPIPPALAIDVPELSDLALIAHGHYFAAQTRNQPDHQPTR